MKIGVIGWGLRRGLGVTAHRPEAGRDVVALCDPKPEAQAKFREQVSASAFVTGDLGEFLAQPLDAVFVLSPDWLHEAHAVACLEAGRAVYLEKPMAITTEGCDRILAAAHRTGTPLYLGHNMRHFGVVRKMREWIQQGLIGQVKAVWCRHFVSYGGDAYFRDWHADRTKSTGLLLQKGSHDIDIVHWLAGGYTEVTSAMGSLAVYGDVTDRQSPGESVEIEFSRVWPPRAITRLNPVVDVEDLSMMLMRLDNGVHASYQQCHFTPDAGRNYTVIGDEGRIENFGDAPGRAIVRLWDHARYTVEEHGDLEYRVPEATGGHGGSDERIVEEFVRFVQAGGETDTSPVAGRMAVAAGVAATESLRSGGVPVKVPTLDPDLRAYFDGHQSRR